MVDVKPRQNGMGLVPREDVLKLIPQLAVTHEQTVFQVYREYKQLSDAIEFTVFVKEPGYDKVRIDGTIQNLFTAELELAPENFRITYWGPASRPGSWKLEKSYVKSTE